MVAFTDESGEGRSETLRAGEQFAEPPSLGALVCTACGYAVTSEAVDSVPACPACGGLDFRRAGIFERNTLSLDVIETPDEEPGWLREARERATRGAPALAYRYQGTTRLLELKPGWIRIGRAASADVRIDDATVSRRHAILVTSVEGSVRALDDRSLNGLHVNGERVDAAELADGDELEVGRYRVILLL